MNQNSLKILVTGEYWHQDFLGLLGSTANAIVTMLKIENVGSVAKQSEFDLIVVAQANRNSIEAGAVEELQNQFPTTPTVALLGSWCEGSARSGEPWPGIPRIYWHQWNGRFAEFMECLEKDRTHEWQLPKTATPADRIIHRGQFGEDEFQGLIAVSAWTHEQFLMIEDALAAFGAKACWIERTTWDGEAISLVRAIVVDDDSQTSHLEGRLRWIMETVGNKPIVLTLGFPRNDEINALRELGVGAVVSKPFRLADIRQAILSVTESGPTSHNR